MQNTKIDIADLFSNKDNTCPINIKVFGIGGGGGNATQKISNINGVETFFINTDLQALNSYQNKIQIGKTLTSGLGAGGDMTVGERAAEENLEDIKSTLQGTDLLFLSAGMGGGTGTGAISVIAQTAKDMGILTVAVVTEPFKFEGTKRFNQAQVGIKQLEKSVDSLIVISNEELLDLVPRQVSLGESFHLVDEVLRKSIQGISDIITTPGVINIDFSDIKNVLKDSGRSLIGIGIAQGEDRAKQACELAITSKLLKSSYQDAKGIIVNVAGNDVTLLEISDIMEIINKSVNEDATIIIGSSVDKTLDRQISVTIIATGLNSSENNSQNNISTSDNLNIEDLFKINN
ncbi:MAG: cell division protein FtsZ [Clostridiaceae bacterium]|jgi:cell division protein FtsZ|nr:cell division protein FtsZ [Clostridiaceae bacterium]